MTTYWNFPTPTTPTTELRTPRSVVVARLAGAGEVAALLTVAGITWAYSRHALSDGTDPHEDFADFVAFIWALFAGAAVVTATAIGAATASLRRHRPGARTTLLVLQAVALSMAAYYFLVLGLNDGLLTLTIPAVVGLALAITAVVALGRTSCGRYCARAA